MGRCGGGPRYGRLLWGLYLNNIHELRYTLLDLLPSPLPPPSLLGASSRFRLFSARAASREIDTRAISTARRAGGLSTLLHRQQRRGRISIRPLRFIYDHVSALSLVHLFFYVGFCGNYRGFSVLYVTVLFNDCLLHFFGRVDLNFFFS